MQRQPGMPTETVINHSGVVPDPVDPLADVPLPTAGRGPTLLERLRGLIRGSGGAFNPRMIALFLGGAVMFFVALGMFVKQSPAKADSAHVGPTRPVEVTKDATYKSAAPVIAAPKEGGDQTAVQQTVEENNPVQTGEQNTHTNLTEAAGRDGARASESTADTGPVENRSGTVYSNDEGGSHGPAESRSSRVGTRYGHRADSEAGVQSRERRYAVDYDAPAITERIAKASESETAGGLAPETRSESSPPANTAPVQLEQGVALPRGLRIKMELLDPFQSGLSAMVRARVLEDVRLKDGKLLVPVNAEVYLPMLELAVATPDNKGRVVVNPKPTEDEMGFIAIGEESRIMLRGTAYGVDNLAGLPGKRTKVNGQNRFSALKRLGARAAGSLTYASPVPLYGLESEIARDTYSYERSQFIVSVPARTRFTFVVGL